ncbi:GNAT family N-acetyltransferase [Micromonospora sp. NBC_01813]|uniref:GNAT family N-acetyltransferase n=1 Tax=Micromonospora sp. NBC_01813 TaxID=2975988 RepID=UPI002DD80DA2|nr:GNAT family N-acetyltransferase [Micromonospora sp. NBC_01813]WSA11457.1 GNAT family N-acetyltransferase [Micromonospora sp. NBC_01813]
MTAPTLRPARVDDLPTLLALLIDDDLGWQREAPTGGADRTVPADYRDAYDAIAADPRNELVVAERDGEVVAMMQLTYIPSLSRLGAERMQIEAVRVRSDLRSQGVGRQMIEWALERARQRGCRLAQLTSDKRREAAHRFYLRLGFKSTHEGMKLVLTPGPGEGTG